MQSKDNKEIDPARLLTVNHKFIIQKETFKDLYYPAYILAKEQRKQIKELKDKLVELHKMQWEIMINTATS